jgi:hypothetical protein
VIPTGRLDVLDAGVELLKEFQRRSGARGRFIVLYLGLRRMGPRVAAMGSATATPTGDIEDFMDKLLTKRHRQKPLVVLTAPFGTTSAKGPYSTRTGETAPGNDYPTNTWRNNLGIQKGIGCPAEPVVIDELLRQPARRLACPHLATDPDGQHMCSLEGTSYRGEEHSIWLRKTADGWQTVDLDQPAVYEEYLNPGGGRIPIFPLIAVLYCASSSALPARESVGIPDFASDFRFEIDQVAELFDCDPGSDLNAAILRLAGEGIVVGRPSPPVATRPAQGTAVGPPGSGREAQPLPELSPPILLNSGLEAELAVAADLARNGWEVSYRGSQSGMGYDLEALQDAERLFVEVKSSVGFTAPELTDSEWRAAQQHREQYVLAIVDFYGSSTQALWYVRDPASNIAPRERTATIYRLPRTAIEPLSTDAEFL